MSANQIGCGPACGARVEERFAEAMVAEFWPKYAADKIDRRLGAAALYSGHEY